MSRMLVNDEVDDVDGGDIDDVGHCDYNAMVRIFEKKVTIGPN